MVEKGKRMVLRQSREPKRKFCQVDGESVYVNAIKASLRDQALSIETGIFIGWDSRQLTMVIPRLHKPVAEETAGLNQKCAGAHRRIAYLQVKDLLRPRMFTPFLKNGTEGCPNDRLSK